jgi:hypothetical protein
LPTQAGQKKPQCNLSLATILGWGLFRAFWELFYKKAKLQVGVSYFAASDKRS